ncbi:hypothetical protein [Clostridium senegalense]|uniref:hypothetical protein n=1 Tax=Clostridium senegalense TaxID=1465809 RepID=UPI000308C575|nr:hypothetical protein [Clostridium senegalense]
MKIGDIIKENQSEVYKKIKTKKKENQVKFTEKDIKNLMTHNYYKRAKGGAIRQVK